MNRHVNDDQDPFAEIERAGMIVFWVTVLVALAILLFVCEAQAQDKLFCPVCQKFKLKSVVRIGPTYTTDMSINEYYDTNGVYHRDNPNFMVRTYWCNKYHQFRKQGNTLIITRIGDNTSWLVVRDTSWIPYQIDTTSLLTGEDGSRIYQP